MPRMNDEQIEKLSNKDFEKLAREAEHGRGQAQIDACWTLGYCYLFGRCVARDDGRAFAYYQKLSELTKGTCAEAFRVMGDDYSEGYSVPINPEQGFKMYMCGAQMGDHECQNNVGYCFVTGMGAPTNIPAAINWFTLSALNGNSNAKLNLAIHHLDPMLKQFFKPGFAIRLLTHVSKENNEYAKRAQLFLAIEYYKGEVVPKYLDLAEHYLKKAAPTLPEAAKLLKTVQEELESKKESSQVFEDERQSLGKLIDRIKFDKPPAKQEKQLIEKWAEAGEYVAMEYLCVMYYEGLHGYPRDSYKFIELLKEMAILGYNKAQYHYARNLCSGKFVKQNLALAKNLFRLAIQNKKIKGIYFNDKIQADAEKELRKLEAVNEVSNDSKTVCGQEADKDKKVDIESSVALLFSKGVESQTNSAGKEDSGHQERRIRIKLEKTESEDPLNLYGCEDPHRSSKPLFVHKS